MKRTASILSLGILLAFPFVSYAVLEKFQTPPKSSWYLTAGGGAAKLDTDSHFNVFNGAPSPFNLDRFSIHSDTAALIVFEGGYRWIKNRNSLPAFSLGLRYQHLFTNSIEGQITQYSLPVFTNYNYKLRVLSNIVLGTGKINIAEWHTIFPFVNGGLGIAANRAANYSEAPLAGVTPRISPNFANKTISTFAYALGAGIDWLCTPSLLLSLGYEFQDLGHLSAGRGFDLWAGSIARPGTLQTNNVIFGVTYLWQN